MSLLLLHLRFSHQLSLCFTWQSESLYKKLQQCLFCTPVGVFADPFQRMSSTKWWRPLVLIFLLCHSSSHPQTRSWRCVILPPHPMECFCRDNNNVSDLWERQEGLRKAIRKLLVGSNIPTCVVTLIYLAGLCITASQHLSLLPQPHPCCSENCIPINRYHCLRCGVREATSCWICLSVCLSNVKAV